MIVMASLVRSRNASERTTKTAAGHHILPAKTWMCEASLPGLRCNAVQAVTAAQGMLISATTVVRGVHG